jgi:type IV secretory pathway VirB4 component
MAQQSATTTNKSTQSSLIINEIKDGIVIMKDGSLRSVVLSSAINFDLMSQAEQDGAEMAFQGFLNSLHFPIQIVIKSRKIDLDNYIDKLKKNRDEQDNPLLADLMEDYIANVQSLIEEVNIMDKQFFVVIPYFPMAEAGKANIVQQLGTILKPANVVSVGAVDFENSKKELRQRVQLVANGLAQMGLRAIPLNTQELIDLYYTSYNPDVAAQQKLIDASQLQAASVVRGGEPLQAPAAPVSPSNAEQITAAPQPQAVPAPQAQPEPAPQPPRNPLEGPR